MGDGESKAYYSRPGGQLSRASFFGVTKGGQRRYRLIALIGLSGPTALLLPELHKTLQLLLLPTAGCCQQPRLFSVPYFFGFEDQYAAGPSRRRENWVYSSTYPCFHRHLPLLSPLTPLAPTHTYTLSRSAPTYTSESTGHKLHPFLFARALIIFVIEAFGCPRWRSSRVL